jgi:hypothetical protein
MHKRTINSKETYQIQEDMDIYAHIGLDIYISRFAIGANVQPATFQKISNGYVTSLPRIQTHFLINF